MSEIEQFNIVIIGAGSLHNKDGFMPSNKDVNTAIQLCKENNLELQIQIIDQNLNYATRLARDEPSRRSEFISTDASRIKAYPQTVTCHLFSPWDLAISIKNSISPVIYLSYNDNSSYEIMNSINSYVMTNRWFVTSKTRVPLIALIEDYITIAKELDRPSSFLLPNPLYDLYSGDVIPEGVYNEFDVVEIKKQLISGCIILDEYLKANYHLKGNVTDVMGWCLNPETPFIKGACESFGLVPIIPLRTPHMEMRQNSGYRKQVFDLLARIISSFAVKNKIVSINEALHHGGWYNRYIYTVIQERIPTATLFENYFTRAITTEEKEDIEEIAPLKVPTLEEIFESLPPSQPNVSMRPEALTKSFLENK